MIHPTAIVEEGAVLGAGCEIHAHAIVRRHAVLGAGVVVHPFAVVGGDPQYLRFDPAIPTFVRVGDGTVIRENVTLNRSIYEGKATVIGAGCLLMAGSHVAHDCELSDKVILTNLVMLAGHVQIEPHAILGGGAGVHQFVRIGEGVMLGGGAELSRDLAPFVLSSHRDRVFGLNLLGLKRRGVSREAIRELKELFHLVYMAGGNYRSNALRQKESGRFVSAEALHFLAFFEGGKRGFARFGAKETSESAQE
jgi:UDP-N-acetylglucosamine acyltransferase